MKKRHFLNLVLSTTKSMDWESMSTWVHGYPDEYLYLYPWVSISVICVDYPYPTSCLSIALTLAAGTQQMSICKVNTKHRPTRESIQGSNSWRESLNCCTSSVSSALASWHSELHVVFRGPVQSRFCSRLGGNRNCNWFFLHQIQCDCNWTWKDWSISVFSSWKTGPNRSFYTS
jgi:hypothetical protein